MEGSEISSFDSAEEIVCENPFFFPKNITSITAEMASASRSFAHMDVYIEHNDNLLMSVLNTDERLLKYGELVFTMEEICNEVGMEETGVELHIRQEGEQVKYSKALVALNNHYTLWESYRWENGCGLKEVYEIIHEGRMEANGEAE